MQKQQEHEQQEKLAPPKSLADELREVLKQSGHETHYLKQEPKTQYLGQEPKTNYLGALGIDISDDVDDEAIYGRNRRRQEKARTNTR